MRVLTTPNVKPSRAFVVEDGKLVIDGGRLADLVKVAGDDEFTEVYLHPADAPGFIARWFERGVEKGRLN